MLTVLTVAYPLAPVGPDAVGGAEQIITVLDRAIAESGHRSLVIACAGSRAAGTLIALNHGTGPYDPEAIARAQQRTGRAIIAALERWPVDVVHMHGFDFDTCIPPPGVPVLATLHCPRDWYSRWALDTARPGTFLNAVSQHQHAALLPNARLIEPIENGVDVESFAQNHRRRRFALMLTRVAPEKGIHIALEASRRAGMPLLIAGSVFPYPDHQRYFASQVVPRLDGERRYLGPAGYGGKRRLLASAACLLIASQVPETSSLVAREAMASGTPVVALRTGALTDTVEHGRTGFLVDNEEEMAQAMHAVPALDAEACRDCARRRFDARLMTSRYLSAYHRIAAAGRAEGKRPGEEGR
jgi:glycosyltransferase involved in cell wall biosynthesis